MKKLSTNYTKTQSVLLAVASSLLTNTLSVQAFPANYIICLDTSDLLIKQISDLNSWFRALFIFLLFFLIWISLAILLSFTERLLSRNHYWNKPRYSRRQLVKSYFYISSKLKSFVMDLYECSDKNLSLLYQSEIIEYTHFLYTRFCPKAMPLKRNIYAAFRDRHSISNINM